MTTDSADKTYYCTRCQIETTLARVCPKCHRKTTLRPRGQTDGGAGGPRRRASSAQLQAVGGPRRWLWLAGGVTAALILGVGIWWMVAARPAKPSGKKKTTPSNQTVAPSPPPDRVFGASRPGRRLAPPPPPRLCGAAYSTTLRYGFEDPKADPKSAMKPGSMGRPKAGPMSAMKPGAAGPKPRSRRPEAVEHLQTFLLVKGPRGWSWVPLSYVVRITLGGRTLTGLKLDRTGGLVPDPRTRRPRKLGFHDTLQPGLRVSDLIGRGHADLVTDPAGGVKVSKLRLRNPLVAQWLKSSIGLAEFLRPRPAKPGARTFEDRRLPHAALTGGSKLEALVRRFRLAPKKQQSPVAGGITYLVDAPPLVRRRARSTTPVQGRITLVPSAPLPQAAELVLSQLPRKGGGTQTVTLKLVHLGKRCNDK